MKPSPLQLEEVFYPALSFEANPGATNARGTIPAEVTAFVHYHEDGRHYAFLNLSQENEKEEYTYKFEIDAFAIFSFDLERAKDAYKTNLPVAIAVNVARLLYGGARELLATVTARGPNGSATLDSAVIEPEDVQLRSDIKPEQLTAKLFGDTDKTSEKHGKRSPKGVTKKTATSSRKKVRTI